MLSDLVEQFVADNKAAADEENAIADNLNKAVVDIDSDDEDKFIMDTFYKPTQIQSYPQSQSLIPQTG